MASIDDIRANFVEGKTADHKKQFVIKWMLEHATALNISIDPGIKRASPVYVAKDQTSNTEKLYLIVGIDESGKMELRPFGEVDTSTGEAKFKLSELGDLVTANIADSEYKIPKNKSFKPEVIPKDKLPSQASPPRGFYVIKDSYAEYYIRNVSKGEWKAELYAWKIRKEVLLVNKRDSSQTPILQPLKQPIRVQFLRKVSGENFYQTVTSSNDLISGNIDSSKSGVDMAYGVDGTEFSKEVKENAGDQRPTVEQIRSAWGASGEDISTFTIERAPSRAASKPAAGTGTDAAAAAAAAGGGSSGRRIGKGGFPANNMGGGGGSTPKPATPNYKTNFAELMTNFSQKWPDTEVQSLNGDVQNVTSDWNTLKAFSPVPDQGKYEAAKQAVQKMEEEATKVKQGNDGVVRLSPSFIDPTEAVNSPTLQTNLTEAAQQLSIQEASLQRLKADATTEGSVENAKAAVAAYQAEVQAAQAAAQAAAQQAADWKTFKNGIQQDWDTTTGTRSQEWSNDVVPTLAQFEQFKKDEKDTTALTQKLQAEYKRIKKEGNQLVARHGVNDPKVLDDKTVLGNYHILNSLRAAILGQPDDESKLTKSAAEWKQDWADAKQKYELFDAFKGEVDQLKADMAQFKTDKAAELAAAKKNAQPTGLPWKEFQAQIVKDWNQTLTGTDDGQTIDPNSLFGRYRAAKDGPVDEYNTSRPTKKVAIGEEVMQESGDFTGIKVVAKTLRTVRSNFDGVKNAIETSTDAADAVSALKLTGISSGNEQAALQTEYERVKKEYSDFVKQWLNKVALLEAAMQTASKSPSGGGSSAGKGSSGGGGSAPSASKSQDLAGVKPFTVEDELEEVATTTGVTGGRVFVGSQAPLIVNAASYAEGAVIDFEREFDVTMSLTQGGNEVIPKVQFTGVHPAEPIERPGGAAKVDNLLSFMIDPPFGIAEATEEKMGEPVDPKKTLRGLNFALQDGVAATLQIEYDDGKGKKDKVTVNFTPSLDADKSVLAPSIWEDGVYSRTILLKNGVVVLSFAKSNPIGLESISIGFN